MTTAIQAYDSLLEYMKLQLQGYFAGLTGISWNVPIATDPIPTGYVNIYQSVPQDARSGSLIHNPFYKGLGQVFQVELKISQLGSDLDTMDTTMLRYGEFVQGIIIDVLSVNGIPFTHPLWNSPTACKGTRVKQMTKNIRPASAGNQEISGDATYLASISITVEIRQ